MSAADYSWWPAAQALMLLGFDVTVLDPEHEDDSYWDEDPAHGVTRVVHNPGTNTWSLHVTEPTTEPQ